MNLALHNAIGKYKCKKRDLAYVSLVFHLMASFYLIESIFILPFGRLHELLWFMDVRGK